jgi:hypothetical protein
MYNFGSFCFSLPHLSLADRDGSISQVYSEDQTADVKSALKN